MKGIPILVAILFMFLGISMRSIAQQSEDAIMLLKVKPAVVLIFLQAKAQIQLSENSKPEPVELSSTGSGFIITPDGYVVTNGHVIQLYHESNEKLLKAELIQKLLEQHGRELSQEEKEQVFQRLMDAPFAVEKKLYVILQNGQVFTGEIKAYSPPITPIGGREAGKAYLEIGKLQIKHESGKDVAVLKIEARNLPTVRLGSSDRVRLTEVVYAVGFPGVVLGHEMLGRQTILDPTITSGKISGLKVQVGGSPVMQTDAPLTWGNSGGPVFNTKGEVIGMATFISMKDEIPIQGFNFLVPSNTIMEFVRVSGANINQESVFNKLWHEAIDLYTRGEYESALKRLDDVLRLYPFLPDARNLQVQIQEKLAGSTSVPETVPGWPYVIVIPVLFGLLAVGVGIFFFVSRKSKEKGYEKPASKIVGRLTGVAGPVSGNVYLVTEEGIKIGRDPAKNNVVIKDDRVSREHAWIGLIDKNVVLRDLNSVNGTFVNSTENQVTEVILNDGDRVIIGKGKFAVFIFNRVA